MSRIADILQQEYKTKGVLSGATSALGKRALEKMDIRNALFGGSGLGSVIGTKIFGKGYSATKRTGAEKSTSPINESALAGNSPVLQELNANMKLTAKNTMALPMMARDMNLMKLNIFKLVKLQGGSANTSKTDIFWQNSKVRESAYNNTIGKMMGDGKLGKMSRALFVGRKERDGQTPESALYVTGTKGEGEEEGSVVKTILGAMVLKKILTATLGFLTGPVGLTILGGFGLFKIIENLAEKNKDKEGVDLFTKSIGGGLDESQFGSEIMAAAEEGQRQREAEALKNRTASGPLERLPPTPQTTLPETGAGAGRGGQGGATAEELIKKDLSPSQLSWVGKADVTDPNIMSRMPSAKPGETTESVFTGPMKPTTPSPTSAPSTGPMKSTTPSSLEISQSDGPSENLINHLKKLETFSPRAFKDYKQYSIGYGTKANNKDEIIDEKEADKRLREVVNETRNKVIDYGKKYGYTWNPSQIDALTSFAYNLGPGILNQVTNNGKRSNEEIAAALPKYNKAGGEVLAGLEKRRNVELAMFNSDSKVATPSITPSTPSTGTVVASASTSIADSKMALASSGKGNTIINNSPTTLASTPTSTTKSTPYQQEFYSALVSNIAL